MFSSNSTQGESHDSHQRNQSAPPSDLGGIEFSYDRAELQPTSHPKLSRKQIINNAELFTELPDPKSLLDSFRQVGTDRPDTLNVYIRDRNRAIADGLMEPGLSQYISYWIKKGVGRWSPVRRQYNESWKKYFEQVKTDLPDIGRRSQRKITESLVQAGMLKNFEKHYGGISESAQETRTALEKTLKRSKGVSLRDRFVVYPVVATIMAAAGAGVAFRMQDNGLLPNPLRYISRTEDDMLEDAAQRLEDMGHRGTANWIRDVDLVQFQREALANLGLTGEEAEQFIRQDALNHIGFFESKLARLTNGDGLFFDGTTIGSYDSTMDAIQLEPSMPRPDTLRHELTHRMGHFNESGFLERVYYDGPDVELEEGICNVAARGLAGAKDYNNALNVSLLAMLIGQTESIESAEQAQAAFDRGIPYIARAFLDDRSVKPLQQLIDLRYGDGTYKEVIRDVYKHGNGASRMNASLLHTLERSGADIVSALEAFERSFSPDYENSFMRSNQLVRITNSILDRTYLDTEFTGNSASKSAAFTASVADTYPESDVSDLFRLYTVYHIGTSIGSGSGESDVAYEQLKKLSERDSGTPWWAEGRTLYARRAFARGDMNAADALKLLETVVEKFPEGYISSKVRSAAQGILIATRDGHRQQVSKGDQCPFSELAQDSIFLDGWRKIHEEKSIKSDNTDDPEGDAERRRRTPRE